MQLAATPCLIFVLFFHYFWTISALQLYQITNWNIKKDLEQGGPFFPFSFTLFSLFILLFRLLDF